MNAIHWRAASAAAILVALAGTGEAKPVAFAGGTTAMTEYGAGTMTEVQVFHAPTYRYSLGGGHLSLDSAMNDDTREITYLRVNFLPKRWNLESAQANAFVWGGLGRARTGEGSGSQSAWNVGGQFDYETRRVYASLRTDLHESSAFSHRLDTLQLGVAPYEHEYDSWALWFVIQGRQYTGRLSEGTEWAALIRLFRRNAWIEAGATREGKLQAMLMVNF